MEIVYIFASNSPFREYYTIFLIYSRNIVTRVTPRYMFANLQTTGSMPPVVIWVSTRSCAVYNLCENSELYELSLRGISGIIDIAALSATFSSSSTAVKVGVFLSQL